MRYDEVVLATGVTPRNPGIPVPTRTVLGRVLGMPTPAGPHQCDRASP